ncbi:hypothetical protein LTR56_018116 [Elasticomyces elasticus]|nr:hypothetical protein LTR56_018116 [Elasticomyces elasticus]KAK3642529.1 hypothetical protein LTR22_016064 [Elasticomyces elasticus]KAK4908874.1 hypothetical protein LTR49_022312 [Elasticomyces elasticus]KAK5748875.1 hypothetical protein LTS12_021045 [Elasticomyces elasticus]
MASTTGSSIDKTTESKMATASVMPMPGLPTAAFKPIIVQSQAMKRKLEHVDFTPREHLAFEEPESVLMMTDIGFCEDTGVSPVAVSQPFRLFTPECIQKFRDEVLSEEVLERCSYKSNLAAMQLRGYAPKYAPFTHAAWHDPETLAIVSKIAGVDLIPNMDFEIGHINVSVKSEKQALAEREAVESSTDGSKPWEDDKPVVGWHRDSYPFVCVTMLSDCTNMIGGETALKKADGGVLRVRGPGMGCAVVMQGRYITHQALRALGAQERITMVTSFRPKSPFLPDDSVLSTVRGISVLSDLYYEFGTYRLEMLQERIRAQLKSLKDDRAAGKKTDTKALKAFLDEQESFVHRTNSEMVRDEDVTEGHQPEMGLEDVKVVDENVQLTTPPNEEEEDEERSAKRSKVE